MAITSSRSTLIGFSGDLVYQQTFNAADNSTSPGQVEYKDLASGANTITVPDSGSATSKGVTIIPPSNNTIAITLKGVSGDTGIALSKTDPSTITLDSVSTFVLNAGDAITGVQFIWT